MEFSLTVLTSPPIPVQEICIFESAYFTLTAIVFLMLASCFDDRVKVISPVLITKSEEPTTLTVPFSLEETIMFLLYSFMPSNVAREIVLSSLRSFCSLVTRSFAPLSTAYANIIPLLASTATDL